MHENISTSERLDRIGELLAKGVYLYLKKEKPPEQDDPKEKKKTSRTHKQSEAVVQK